MAEKKEDKKIEESDDKKASKAELDVNSTMAGAIAYQNWEQAKDKSVDDYYIGLRRTVVLKLSIFMRRLRERRLRELADENGGKITVELEIKVAKELMELDLFTKMDSTTHERGDVTNTYEDRQNKGVVMTSKDIMSEVYYHDVSTLEKMDALLTSLIDEEDLRVTPKPTMRDVVREDAVKDLLKGDND